MRSWIVLCGFLGCILSSAGAASLPPNIENDFDSLAQRFKEHAGLFTAEDFRVTTEARFLETIKFSAPEVQAQLGGVRKKLDEMQRKNRSLMMLNGVRVSAKQFPRIHELSLQAAKALNLPGPFNVFVVNSPEFNAFTYSYNAQDFDIVLHSGAVENLSDETLLGVLGHEMGHVKDQAVLISVFAASLYESHHKDSAAASHQKFYEKVFSELPLTFQNHMARVALELVAEKTVSPPRSSQLISEELADQLSRSAEVTADRAALIVTGSELVTLKMLATLAYGSKALSDQFDVEELIQQISEVLADSNDMSDILEIVGEQSSHPFNVLRLIQARAFAQSKPYQSLKTMLGQNAFAKELDLLVRVVGQQETLAKDLEKYKNGDAEEHDILVRLKIERQFQEKISGNSELLQVLEPLLMSQLIPFAFGTSGDSIFDTFVSKVTADRTDTLRSRIVPVLLERAKQERGAADFGTTHSAEEAAAWDRKLEALGKLNLLNGGAVAMLH